MMDRGPVTLVKVGIPAEQSVSMARLSEYIFIKKKP
jgi:hypothetical protein